MKDKLYFKIGLLSGFIPLIVGVVMFLAWWLARALFAIDLSILVITGFYWLFISVPIAITGIIFLFIFIINNKSRFLLNFFLGLFIILINIPTTIIILEKYSDINNRAYIEIFNNSKFDIDSLTLKSESFEKTIGSVASKSSIVDYYYPKLLDERGDKNYPTFETVKLVISEGSEIHYLKISVIKNSQCRKLYINDKFKLSVEE